MIEIHAFDPHAATAAEWAEFHEFRRQRAEEDDPGEPVLGDADFEYSTRRNWPLFENRRLIARRDGGIVGSASYSFRRAETPDYEAFAPFLYGWGGVLKPYRRSGVATALLRTVLGFMLERGKTILSCGTHGADGHGFLAAIGAEQKHRSVENRLEFAGLDWDQLAGWRATALAPGDGLRWEVHAGRVPMERLATLVQPFTELLGDVPLGELDVPPQRYELQGWMTWYEEMDRHGGMHFLVLVMQGDEVAAMCEASWDARFPERVFQALTGVARKWRGKGLAKGVKAAMLRLIRERQPQVRLMITSNAEVNAPMLSINNRLGFVVRRRDGSYQIGRDTLAAWLATRG